VNNAISAALQDRATSKIDKPQSLIKSAFNMLTSHDKRRAALQNLHDARFAKVTREMRREIKADTAILKAERATALKANKHRFDSNREQLIERQDDERAALRDAWKERKAERRSNLSALKKTQAARSPEQRDFTRAASATDDKHTKKPERPERQRNRKRKGRSRSRRHEP
jgi:hypothetical protein